MTEVYAKSYSFCAAFTRATKSSIGVASCALPSLMGCVVESPGCLFNSSILALSVWISWCLCCKSTTIRAYAKRPIILCAWAGNHGSVLIIARTGARSFPGEGNICLYLRDPYGSTRKSVRLKIRSQLFSVDIWQAFYARKRKVICHGVKWNEVEQNGIQRKQYQKSSRYL